MIISQVSYRTNGPLVFAITAAGVVSCGSPKKSPSTSLIVQIIFYLGPLRSVKISECSKHSRLETYF